jgi:hypothetical protein
MGGSAAVRTAETSDILAVAFHVWPCCCATCQLALGHWDLLKQLKNPSPFWEVLSTIRDDSQIGLRSAPRAFDWRPSRLRAVMFKHGVGGRLPPDVRRNDWKAQAKSSVDGVRDEKYRSNALRIEVKLAEVLARTPPGEPRALEDHPRPDKFRTAACMELLGDLCDIAGPFSAPLRTIREELAKGIYSDYYLADEDARSFDQLPFFSVAERLAGEKVKMAEELTQWQEVVAERDRAVQNLEESIQTTRTSVNRGLAQNEATAAKLLATQARAVEANADARAAEDELKKLRAELNATKEELLLTRAENLQLKGPTGALTPRPDWNALDPFGKENYESERTLDLTKAVLDELEVFKAKTEDLVKLEEAQVLIEPEAEATDPFVGMDISRTPAATPRNAPPAVSEAAKQTQAPANEEGPPRLRTLGRGSEIPRFLRSVEDKVLVKKLSKRDTEEFIKQVWEGKVKSDAARKLPLALHEYLYEFLRGKHGGNHPSAVEEGYNLMEALRKFSYDADVMLFFEVLTGALCEGVYHDRNVMTKALEGYLPAVAGHENLISREDLYAALHEFFPSKSEDDHAGLRKALFKDNPEGEFVNFLKLFEEDANLNQGEFITAIYEQHWMEINKYVEQVRGVLNGVARKEPGSNIVSLQSVRDALRAHDPTKSDMDIDVQVARGAQFGTSSEVTSQCELAAEVDMASFQAKLFVGLVKRVDNFSLKALLKYAKPKETPVEGAAAPEKPED